MILYALSVSLQVAGGILLLLNFGSTKERFIKMYFPGSNFVNRDDKSQCVLDEKRAMYALRNVFLNIIAICNIIFGYLVAIWGENEFSKVLLLCLIVFITTALLVIDFLTASFIAQRKLKKYLRFDYDDLEKYGVESPATVNEVKEYLGIE